MERTGHCSSPRPTTALSDAVMTANDKDSSTQAKLRNNGKATPLLSKPLAGQTTPDLPLRAVNQTSLSSELSFDLGGLSKDITLPRNSPWKRSVTRIGFSNSGLFCCKMGVSAFLHDFSFCFSFRFLHLCVRSLCGIHVAKCIEGFNLRLPRREQG